MNPIYTGYATDSKSRIGIDSHTTLYSAEQFYLPDFPIDILPPKMRRTATELIRSGAHLGIVAALMPHFASLCVQPLVDSEIPHGGIARTTSFVYLNAASGSGKSAVRQLLEQPFVSCQQACEANDAQKLHQYEAAALWRGAPGAFARNERSDDGPVYATKLLTDPTPESIFDQSRQCSSLSVSDDEGQLLRAPWFQRSVSTYIRMLDGQPQAPARATKSSPMIVDACGSILISVQPEDTVGFDARHGRIFRLKGLASRGSMIQVPESTPRFIDADNPPAPPNLDVWRDQVTGFLGEALVRAKSGVTPRRVIRSTQQAKRCAAALHNEYLRRGMPGGDLAELPEHAPRQMERAVKFAVAMHAFEQLPGEVSSETMECAAQMVRWGTEHYRHRFMPRRKLSAIEQNAQVLHVELIQLVGKTRQREFELRWLVDTAPNMGLSPSQAKRAFDFLCEVGYARYFKRSNRTWIELSPEHYPTIYFSH
ncbi:hypothetical protein WS72_18235 [Burkholderia savannae]|uniref:DUF3987 domain-containing protein n=1 Tax=Burkholderia savannae TaxID=1637837 RepID=A0ABR5THX6_9BURK|nr:DUF3987 domain-containing protein [Burkholderia savannae]KWZ44601.1 hypothetical protein WS72_18235 [Burkholderia savannae]